MALEVEVGTAGDALELAPAEGVLVLDVAGGGGVEGQLVGIVLAHAQLLAPHAQVHVPRQALVAPVGVPSIVLRRRDEELHLGLLELARAEDEVARRDLVAERLADLGDSKRWLRARALLHAEEVQEDALGRLRSQVGHRAGLLQRADVGLEHQVEGARLGQLAVALARVLRGFLGTRQLVQVIRTEAPLAGLAVHHRVGEAAHVTGHLPHARVLQDGRVEPHDVAPRGDHAPPPGVLDAPLELDAQGAVVVGVADAAVDLGGLEDESAAFAEGHDGVHEGGRFLGHGAGMVRSR